jgi:hypothetical protein
VRDLLAPYDPNPPRIYVVDPVVITKAPLPPHSPSFRRWYGNRVDPSVYINVKSDIYQRASKGDRAALLALAASVSHEIIHGTTKDEQAPSRREIEVLQGFLRDATLCATDRCVLLERVAAVKKYGGVK